MIQNKLWIGIVSLLGIGVAMVLALLAGMLFGLTRMDTWATPTPTAILTLPTAAQPTLTPGPPTPIERAFVAKSPILGYSDCQVWGVYGQLEADTLENIEVVLWEERAGLVALDIVSADAVYTLELAGDPPTSRVWVQVYRGDLPVSEAKLLQFQTDCVNGFRVYEVDWRINGE